jgi:hypothetical protein
VSEPLLMKRTPAPKRLQLLASRLAEEQVYIRSLESELESARKRRSKLVLRLTGGGVSEREIASRVGVTGGRVDEWKRRAAEDGAAAASKKAAAEQHAPIDPASYYLVHQLLGERLTPGELRDLVTARSIQARVANLQDLLRRGWVQSADGIYEATARARKAVSW